MRQPILLLSGVFAATSGHVDALTITQDDLPTALIDCTNSDCSVSLSSSVDTEFMSAFMLARARTDASGYDFNWLIRYKLTPPSALTSIVDPDYGTSATTDYTGHFWLEAPQNLSLDSQNQFRVYTDQVIQDPDRNNHEDDLSTWMFGMEAVTAIGGSAAHYNSGSDGIEEPIIIGDLAVLDGLFICVECGIEVRLNLVGLEYSATGAGSLNLDDNRGLLLEYREFYNHFNDTHAFHVQAIPPPAAAWLFGWGLATIGLATTKTRDRLVAIDRHHQRHPTAQPMRIAHQ